mgnify:FL=1
MATGAQAFRYEIRTGLLPFIFLFNNELLMIGVSGPFEFALVVSSSLLAMLMFAAATQNHFLTRCRWYEVVALLLVCFTLFRPEFWWDMVYPRYATLPAAQVYEIAAKADRAVRLKASGETLTGKEVSKTIELPLAPGATGQERLRNSGVTLRREGDKTVVANIAFGSAAKKAGLDLDWTIDSVIVQTDRPGKHWMFVPALGLLGMVVLSQIARRRKERPQPAAA